MRRNLLLTVIFAGAGLATVQAQIPQGTPTGQPPGATTRGADPTNRPGFPDDVQQTETKIDEKRFVKDALLGGMTEVELGKVALERASSDPVKQFAQKMIDDHSKANEDLKQLASKENINVPDSLDSKHQSRVEKLSKLPGKDEMRAQLLSVFEAPMAQTLAVMDALLASVVYCLDNKCQQEQENLKN